MSLEKRMDRRSTAQDSLESLVRAVLVKVIFSLVVCVTTSHAQSQTIVEYPDYSSEFAKLVPEFTSASAFDNNTLTQHCVKSTCGNLIQYDCGAALEIERWVVGLAAFLKRLMKGAAN